MRGQKLSREAFRSRVSVVLVIYSTVGRSQRTDLASTRRSADKQRLSAPPGTTTPPLRDVNLDPKYF